MSEVILKKKQRLKEIILEKSLKRGDFILASGARSNYMFDLKPTMLDPEGANLSAELLLEKIVPDIDAVGGLELGACPIVSAVCVISYQLNRRLKTFYVRKEKKERGTKRLIEGCELKKGDRVIILEDVTTKGGSVMAAVKAVLAEGGVVVKVLSLVDRQEGATENLAKEGITLDSIFTRGELL
ncbi:MAG TPA: orotate phosphoribosyltransferase [Alphaproteobacteria bacterium]|nr:orotate phosphoribosyltransferase [Alphaproteobacteria bacterium]